MWTKENLPAAVKGIKNLSDDSLTAFLSVANAELSNGVDEIIAIGKAFAQIENVGKGFPKFFYCRHMTNGVAGYQAETVMVDDDAIKRMLPSFAGKPVYIEHRNVNLDTMKEEACGYVVESFWNELDGWAWAKVMLTDAEAISLAEQGKWSVSNAYIPTDCGGSGRTHNVPFNRSIQNGSFTHLALVDTPRYEAAKIFTPDAFKKYQEEKRQQLKELHNSKPNEEKKGNPMFEMFKLKREPVTEADAETSISFTNSKGETVTATVNEMINAVEKAQAKAPAATVKVKVGDKEMTTEELVNSFVALSAAAPAAKTEEKPADTAPAAKTEEKPLENGGKHFEELENAAPKPQSGMVMETGAAKEQRGANLYGSAGK